MPVISTLSRRFSLMVFVLLLTTIPLMAQTQPATLINEGQPIEGTFDAQNFAQVYVFVAVAEDVVSLSAVGEVPVALLVTNADGTILAQSVSPDAETGALVADLVLNQSGSFFVTVLPAPNNPAQGSYTLTLNGATAATDTAPTATPEETTAVDETITPASGLTYTEPEQILISNGIEVRLDWDAPVDMNLEIRDPFGNSLFWNSRTSPVGGTFGFDANGLCEVITEQPFETATWAPGFLPSGSYEVLVFYRQACENPDPVSFTVTVTVDGVQLDPIQGVLSAPVNNQNSVYVANFNVAPDGQATSFAGGVYPDASFRILPASVAELTASTTPIALDTTTTGSIVGEQFYEVYSYTAQPDEVISLNLEATSGSLDTLLQVIDANGTLIDVNDDAVGTTNSSISSLRFVQGGTYYIVATRYGKELGGTEGAYNLSVAGATAGLPAEVLSLGLPDGDIAVTLTWNTTADLQLLVRDPVGDAVFDDVPQINSGGTLAADGNVNCTIGEEGVPVSHTYWPFGFLRPGIYEIEVWFQNNCNDTTPVEFTLSVTVDGQPVLIERQRPVTNQRFVTTFIVNPDRSVVTGDGGYIGGGTASFDYSEEAVSATPIVLGQPAIGSITPDNAFDVYAFEGTAGQVITVRLAASSQTLDTKVFLVSPTGIEIANNDDADPALAGTNGRTTDSIINAVTLPEDGQYLIVASRFGTIYGGTIGGYVLTLE
jgi:hypothetical protein